MKRAGILGDRNCLCKDESVKSAHPKGAGAEAGVRLRVGVVMIVATSLYVLKTRPESPNYKVGMDVNKHFSLEDMQMAIST